MTSCIILPSYDVDKSALSLDNPTARHAICAFDMPNLFRVLCDTCARGYDSASKAWTKGVDEKRFGPLLGLSRITAVSGEFFVACLLLYA